MVPEQKIHGCPFFAIKETMDGYKVLANYIVHHAYFVFSAQVSNFIDKKT